jgi:hypothetical protein
MDQPHINTINSHWNKASHALLIAYATIRGKAAKHNVDYDEALESIKKLFEWAKNTQSDKKN